MTHYKSLLLALLWAFAMIFGGMGSAAADLDQTAEDEPLPGWRRWSGPC